MLFQRDNVLVEQADAALAGTAGDGILIVGAAVDAYALKAWCGQSQEPVPVGPDVAAAVVEIVFPGRGILYHSDFERFACWGLGGAHVAAALLVAFVLAHAAGELGHHDGVARGVAVIDRERLVQLGNHDKGSARRSSGQGWQLY